MDSPRHPEKLIRDLIPRMMPETEAFRVRQVDDRAIAPFVADKILEEGLEVVEAAQSGNREDLILEMADLLEVMERLAELHGLTWDEILQVKALRAKERGAFLENHLLSKPPGYGTRLISGNSPTLLGVLMAQLERCTVANLAVSFVMSSGVAPLRPALVRALERGAAIRLLTSDYLDVTEPEALEQLVSLPGDISIRSYREGNRSFHVKAYMFEHGDGQGLAVVGSSNLSRSALTSGIEWNYIVHPMDARWPLAELRNEFQRLFHSPHSYPVDTAFIEAYRARRKPRPLSDEPTAPALPSISPRPAQIEALVQLQQMRQQGERKAMVIAATGIGKTFLAAFDSREFPRVLFLAHREELLQQAQLAFARVRPDARSGFYRGGQYDTDVDLLFASVSTLSRTEHLQRFAPDYFDYVVVDEFHHAAARSYLSVLHYFSPRFLLGLTATPYRGDNRDVYALCDGNVAYRLTFMDAIGLGWLCPFHYHGIYDETDYGQITWRNGKYDAEDLSVALSNSKRAAAILAEFRKHPSSAALGFCVSIDHARYMAEFFNQNGVPSLAVHSGEDSPDRAEAIAALRAGKVSCLFTVDLFNEGVDIPEVDLVMFLRPTESITIFLQQLGRGLRLHAGKEHLKVLDFIGNYRKASFKLPLIAGQLEDEPDPATLRKAIAEFRSGELQASLPLGVELHLDLQAINLMEQMAKQGEPRQQRLLNAYQDVKELLGRTPTMLEVHRWGQYDVRLYRQEFKTWFGLLRTVGDLLEAEQRLEREAGAFLSELEKTPMTKSYKMVTLQAFLDKGGLDHPVEIRDLANGFRAFFQASAKHRRDIQGTEVAVIESVSDETLIAYLEKNPIAAWTNPGKDGLRQVYFAYDAETGLFSYTGPKASDAEELASAVRQRVEYRLSEYFEVRFERKNVFNVINSGEDRGIIMLGNDEAAPIPRNGGWKRVRILDRIAYAKFAKIAINVLKDEPNDSASMPNHLTEVLEEMFGPGGYLPQRGNKVRISPDPEEPETWLIEPYRTERPVSPIVHVLKPETIQEPKLRLPLLSLRAAAGGFGPHGEPDYEDWVEVPESAGLTQDMVLIKVVGHSMEPTIQDGDICAFRPIRPGSRNGRIVLAQSQAISDVDTDGGTFTVKRFRSTKRQTGEGWEHESIVLEPDNPSYEPITLESSPDTPVHIQWEFVRVLDR